MKNEVCKKCSRNPLKYTSTGECAACYKRRRRRTDPAVRERDRQVSRRWKEQNRERNRARDRDYGKAYREDRKTPCPECGGPSDPAYAVCQACHSRRCADLWDKIEVMWNQGATYSEMTSALGISEGNLGGQLARMREAGRDVPYRYRNTKRQAA